MRAGQQAPIDRDGTVIDNKIRLSDPVKATVDFSGVAPSVCKLLAKREAGKAL
jgi:hypothetical protein